MKIASVQSIPTNFTIPSGYRRTFILKSGDYTQRIKAVNGSLIVSSSGGIDGEPPRPAEWVNHLNESIESIRLDCSNQNKP